MQINKGTRHQKIVGDFGEHLVCNWLSRSGFEVSRVDHTGIDVVAYNPTVKQRYGITVKARTRMPETLAESVYVFKREDRKKMRAACKWFECKPWIAIYVESDCAADLYLTSLANYDSKYRVRGRKTESWKMTSKQMDGYTADAEVKHFHVVFSDENWWVIKLKAQRTRKKML
jgi:Holliday junction resolvase-like predicted endonuclease